MSEQTQHALNLDAKLQAEDLYYASVLGREGDRKIFWWSIFAAVLLHVLVMFVRFPDMSTVIEKEEKPIIVVKKYVPPPPKVERQQVVQKEITRKVPLPAPDPDDPEPIREPEPEIEQDPLPFDADVVLGVPEAPPPSGPLLAGVGDVTNPVLIESTKVQPEYPEIARQARLTGNVILQAVITKSGTVEDVKVLRVDKPNIGFESAAVAAVEQWRYKPATQAGRPVDVYFTINVSFTLH
jgi:protein TonB